MPMIKIEYDDKKLTEDEASNISEAVQEIVSKVTKLPSVFVYANTSKIKIQIAPVEIFIEISDFKIQDLDELTAAIKNELKSWKDTTKFKQPINLTVIPMHWKVELGI